MVKMKGRQMNRSLLGIIASLAVTLPLYADNASSSKASSVEAERQVLQLEREWTAAEIKRNAVKLRQILDDQFVVTFGSGEVTDKEGFIKDVVGDANDVILSQDLTDETIRVDRDTAVVVGTDTVHGTNKGEPYTQVLRITTTYIRREGKWMALAEHMVARKPPADPRAAGAAKAPAYVVVEYEITDPAGFKDFIKGDEAIRSPRIFLARHAKGVSLAGEPPKWIGILQFPSVEDALAFDSSPEFTALKPIRDKSTKWRSFVVKGLPTQ
jgi:uncharacterized protein (DUF1330 family)